MTIILGIDPGSRVTGYGIIKSNGYSHHYIASGRIVTVKAKSTPERLKCIFQGILEVAMNYRPEVGAIEEIFMAKNALSALKLGQASGAAVAAMAYYGLSVTEYPTRTIKKVVSGFGGAEKSQVQYMIKLLLNVQGQFPLDASDALAVAMCHAQHRV